MTIPRPPVRIPLAATVAIVLECAPSAYSCAYSAAMVVVSLTRVSRERENRSVNFNANMFPCFLPRALPTDHSFTRARRGWVRAAESRTHLVIIGRL